MGQSKIFVTGNKMSSDDRPTFLRMMPAWFARWRSARNADGNPGELSDYSERDLFKVGFGSGMLKLTAVSARRSRTAPASAAPDPALGVEHEYGIPLGEAGMGVMQH